MFGKLIGFLLVPLLIGAVAFLGWDDLRLRNEAAGAAVTAAAQAAAVKVAQASEKTASELAEKACSRQAVVSLQGGRTIERIIQAPAPSNGRGMVTASDLRSIVGQP